MSTGTIPPTEVVDVNPAPENPSAVPESKPRRGRPPKNTMIIGPVDPEAEAKLGFIHLALTHNAGIDVIERLVSLQERA